MARKTGQIIRRGSSIWLVRIYIGRDPDTRKRVYIAKSIHGGLRDAQAHLNRMLAERDLGRNIRSSRQTLGQYLEHWLDISARPRLRPKSYRDYSSLLTRYICPRLGARPLGELSAAEIQTLYSELLDRGLSARTIRYIAPLPRYLSDRHGPDDRTEFIGATHRPLSVELQANAGILSRLTGVPSVERFFGGNRASTPFIPGEPWSVRDQPYIRSIPENEPGSAITNANIGGARYINALFSVCVGLNFGRSLYINGFWSPHTSRTEFCGQTFFGALSSVDPDANNSSVRTRQCGQGTDTPQGSCDGSSGFPSFFCKTICGRPSIGRRR